MFNLVEDFGLSGDQYQTCVLIVFAIYVTLRYLQTSWKAFYRGTNLMETLFLTLNMQLRRLKPRRITSGVAVAWGIVSLCTRFVHKMTQLIVVRLLLYVK